MFHDAPPEPPRSAAPAAPPSIESAGMAWRPSDLVAGIVLLLLGFGAAVLIGVALATRGLTERGDPTTAFLFSVITLLVEGWSGVLVLLLARRRGVALRDLGFRAPTQWAFVPLALLGAYGAVLAYGLVILAIERAAGVDLSSITQGNAIPADLPRTPLIWGTLALAVVVVGPAGEELFFRALIYRGLARLTGPVPAIVASGIAFALVHANASVIVPFALVGMVFAWVYRASGSLWTTIVAHAIFNAVSFVLTLYGVAP